MTVKLVDYLSGWENHNSLLVKMIEPLGPDDLALSAGRDLWTVGMLASHVVATRAWWFGEWMGEGGPSFAAMGVFDEGEEVKTRDARAIVEGLHTSWAVVAGCIGRWTESDLGAEFQRPERGASRGRPWRTRRYIVWHVAEHDVHHGGEISVTLGMHGRPGLDL